MVILLEDRTELSSNRLIDLHELFLLYRSCSQFLLATNNLVSTKEDGTLFESSKSLLHLIDNLIDQLSERYELLPTKRPEKYVSDPTNGSRDLELLELQQKVEKFAGKHNLSLDGYQRFVMHTLKDDHALAKEKVSFDSETKEGDDSFLIKKKGLKRKKGKLLASVETEEDDQKSKNDDSLAVKVDNSLTTPTNKPSRRPQRSCTLLKETKYKDTITRKKRTKVSDSDDNCSEKVKKSKNAKVSTNAETNETSSSNASVISNVEDEKNDQTIANDDSKPKESPEKRERTTSSCVTSGVSTASTTPSSSIVVQPSPDSQNLSSSDVAISPSSKPQPSLIFLSQTKFPVCVKASGTETISAIDSLGQPVILPVVNNGDSHSTQAIGTKTEIPIRVCFVAPSTSACSSPPPSSSPILLRKCDSLKTYSLPKATLHKPHVVTSTVTPTTKSNASLSGRVLLINDRPVLVSNGDKCQLPIFTSSACKNVGSIPSSSTNSPTVQAQNKVPAQPKRHFTTLDIKMKYELEDDHEEKRIDVPPQTVDESQASSSTTTNTPTVSPPNHQLPGGMLLLFVPKSY